MSSGPSAGREDLNDRNKNLRAAGTWGMPARDTQEEELEQ